MDTNPANAAHAALIPAVTGDVVDVRPGYDRWADVYDVDGNPLLLLEEPQVVALLGDVRDRTVADIGCGTGRHTLWLAAAGARVAALDFSAGMLARAQAKATAAGLADAIAFQAHDLTQTWPLPTAAYARVVCSLVLEHIADLGHFYGELRRVCAPDGRIIISELHPAMALRGISARFTDPESGRETRPRSMGHTISDFVTAGLHAGLELTHISEHAVDGALAQRAPRAEKYLGWPMLLMLAWQPK